MESKKHASPFDGLTDGGLFEQMGLITKANAYDILSKQVHELKAENDRIKAVLKDFMYNWDALGNANDYSHIATKASEILSQKTIGCPFDEPNCFNLGI